MVNKSGMRQFWGLLTGLLLVVWGIEYGTTCLFGDLTLAPPLSIIFLGILAIFFTWRKVLLAIPCFVVLSYCLILDTARFPAVRAISIFLAGILASWASYQRVKIILHAQEIGAILKNLDLPWVLSDEAGNVSQISPAALRLLGCEERQVVGISFFSIFSPLEQKGELIRKYLDLFGTSPSPISQALSFRASAIKCNASLSPLELPGGKKILTTLTPV